ncbi:hypothetical protein O6H91_09G045500 [Diphasiastrum complanatum]|uniref:Uncharacterized protein n=1 Tax=Diphasiastrum complanatum TaxID=34168 RepID=A0ACC2CNU1_DIPCM|nr:hypothetical protein O6H91_09G045500 [Diphasiastrum complanatum]
MSDIATTINFGEEFIQTSRGLKLYTCRWVPADQEIKGLIFLCHGYGMECSLFMKGSGENLAKAGYGVYGIDYEGHGKSDGERCYITKFENLVHDCMTFFKSVRESTKLYKNKPAFLFGESMGGCIALLISRKEPNSWNGAVLVAPMCKISEKVKPPAIVVKTLSILSPFIGSWKIVPSKNVIDAAFKVPEKRAQIRANPYAYQDKPRVKTVVEMLTASQELEKNLHEITIPFLVLHGEADTVTDPEVSGALYDSAKSSDKTFKLYPELWHGLLCGETDEDINRVFSDIISWLDKRSSGGFPKATMHLNETLLKGLIQEVSAL